jgi:hypothetical protein
LCSTLLLLPLYMQSDRDILEHNVYDFNDHGCPAIEASHYAQR